MDLKNKFEKVDKLISKNQNQLDKQIARYYSQTLKEIRGIIAQYEAKGLLTKNDMFRYNRLSKLEKEISQEIAKLTSRTARTLKSGLGSVFQENYYRTAFILETEVQAKLGFSLLNPKLVESAINNPLDRIGWRNRNKANQAILTRQIREELVKGLNLGKSYKDISKGITDRMNIGATKAIRIAQTEGHRIQNDARLKSAEHAASKGVIMKKRWIATLDSSTRDSHQELDGKEIDLDDNFSSSNGGSGPAPGQLGTPEDDINCRCTFITVIKGFEPTVRRARGEGIIPYTNYQDWFNNRISK